MLKVKLFIVDVHLQQVVLDSALVVRVKVWTKFRLQQVLEYVQVPTSTYGALYCTVREVTAIVPPVD